MERILATLSVDRSRSAIRSTTWLGESIIDHSCRPNLESLAATFGTPPADPIFAQSASCTTSKRRRAPCLRSGPVSVDVCGSPTILKRNGFCSCKMPGNPLRPTSRQGHKCLLTRISCMRIVYSMLAKQRFAAHKAAMISATRIRLTRRKLSFESIRGCIAWLGVFISAPAKSRPTRIELYPWEFVFCPYRGLRGKGLRIIERRYCHVNPFRTDFVLDKQRRATTRGERA